MLKLFYYNPIDLAGLKITWPSSKQKFKKKKKKKNKINKQKKNQDATLFLA
jgi:hypothetical protein